ncbi:MAG: hypothetical protein Q9159_004904 [Coniocarpon cinnabarinum]
MTDTITAIPGTVLITGGCGFLGSHIVDLLLSSTSSTTTKPTAIHVLDLRAPSEPKPSVTYHTADLTSADALAPILAQIRPDVVIHTASPAVAFGGPKALQIMRTVNIDGTKTLLNECRKAGVKGFVHTSSASVLSDTRTDLVNADERYPVITGDMQREYYSRTKAEAEEWVMEQNQPPSDSSNASAEGKQEKDPLLTIAIRPSAIFGEAAPIQTPDMIAAFHRGQTGWQFGDNDNLFDFTYVGNVAHAHVLAARRLLEAWDRYTSASSTTQKDTQDVAKLSIGGGARPQEIDDRVDGQAILITNDAPVYFWDFARGLWHAYDRHLTSLSKSQNTTISVPPPATKIRSMSFALALLLSSLASWFFWIFRLGAPRLDSGRVRYSCMRRYFATAKARALLGYSPLFELNEGVERTAEWWAQKYLREQSEGDKKLR